MKRTTRAELARQTLRICEEGHYTTQQGQHVSIRESLTAAVQGTRVYDGVSMDAGEQHPVKNGRCLIEVTAESALVAIQRLDAAPGGSVGVLNFASAKNPGGGFLNGAQAQEEALARSSGLYPSLLAAREYYERNRQCPTCLYLDLLIASPGVPFFRDDEGQLLEQPVLATVITAPAPNAGAVARNEPHRMAEVESVLRHRAELVLRVAALHGITDFVLGAWGCGVFRNDPAIVARAFADLVQPGRPYSMCFDRVIFAIFDAAETGENLAAFRKEFSWSLHPAPDAGPL